MTVLEERQQEMRLRHQKAPVVRIKRKRKSRAKADRQRILSKRFQRIPDIRIPRPEPEEDIHERYGRMLAQCQMTEDAPPENIHEAISRVQPGYVYYESIHIDCSKQSDRKRLNLLVKEVGRRFRRLPLVNKVTVDHPDAPIWPRPKVALMSRKVWQTDIPKEAAAQ